MEREVRVNLLTLLGVLIATISFTMVPAFSSEHSYAGTIYHTDFTIADILNSTMDSMSYYAGFFAILCIVGIVASIVTPVAGFILLFGSLSLVFRIPYSWVILRSRADWFVEPGTYLMVFASALIIVSIVVRVMIVNRSLRLEHGLNKVMMGLVTVSYGRFSSLLSPRIGSRIRPNITCLVGVGLGIASLAFTWEPGYSMLGHGSGLALLTGDGAPRLAVPQQLIVVSYLVGLLSTLYTPLGGTVQFVSALAYAASTGAFYEAGPWIAMLSSVVIMHSLLMPLRDSRGVPRLAIAENLRTFRRI